MPDSTPIYGFTFPCPGEVVSAADFTLLANQIDAKLLDVNNDLDAALLRRNFRVFPPGTQVITAGVDTVLTIPGSSYVIPESGVWVFSAAVFPQTLPTVQMMRARIQQNGVTRSGFTHNTENNVTNAPTPFGPIVAAVGDTITIRFLYAGAATMTVRALLSAKLIVRIA